MTTLREISENFDDILDTPISRRRQVDQAADEIRQRYAQAGRPFSLLAGGIAGSIPGVTENLRRTLVGMGGTGFKTQGENLADQLRGIDTSTEAGQRQVVQIVAQVDPGRAEALKQFFDQKNLEKERRDFDRQKFEFDQRKFEEQKRAALIDEGIRQGQLDQRIVESNQQVLEWEASQLEGEGLEQYYTGVAENFAPGTPNANPQLFALYSSAAANNIPHAAVAQSIDAISTNRSDVERELQIQAIARDQEMTEEEAARLLFQMDNGLIDVDISEDGQVTVVNVPAAMQQAREGNISGEDLPVIRLSAGIYDPPEFGFQDTLYSMAPYIPGVINRVQQAFNRIGPQLSNEFFSERESTAAALVNNVSLDLYAAVRESLGAGRLSNVMIGMIENSIGIQGRVFDSEANYRSVLRMNSERLRALAVQLRSDLEQGVFADAGSRSDAQQQLSALNKAIQQFGVPEIIAASEFTPELIEITDNAILAESIVAMGSGRFNDLLTDTAIDEALKAKGF